MSSTKSMIAKRLDPRTKRKNHAKFSKLPFEEKKPLKIHTHTYEGFTLSCVAKFCGKDPNRTTRVSEDCMGCNYVRFIA